jgi:hypothetical protein
VVPSRWRATRGFQQALAADIPAVVVDGISPVTWQALVSGMLSF